MSEERTYLDLERDEAAQALRRWWETLQEHHDLRAQLRRCRTVNEVTLQPAYHRLVHALQRHARLNALSLALVAALAAHIKADTTEASFAAQMAAPRGEGGRARVSGLRFRRLLQVEEHERLLHPLIRIVRLLDGRANLLRLANDAYWWNDRVRRQWAFDYYGHAPQEA